MYEGILGIFVKMSLNLIHYLSFKLLKEKIVFSFPILKLLNKKIKKNFKIIFFILFIFFFLQNEVLSSKEILTFV